MESVERREVDFVEVVVGSGRVLVARVEVGQAFRTLEFFQAWSLSACPNLFGKKSSNSIVEFGSKLKCVPIFFHIRA